METSPGSATYYAFLGNNSVVSISASGDVVGQLTLAAAPRAVPSAGRFLAAGRGATMFILVPGNAAGPTRIVRLDTATGCFENRAAFPKLEGRGIAVGQRTGRIYVVGNTSSRSGVGAARALMLDPEGRRVISSLTVRTNQGWAVQDIAMSPDEARLFVSYHGPSTQGADWVALMRKSMRRCTPARAGDACIRLHGAVVVSRLGTLYATTGDPPLILQFRASMQVARQYNTGLVGNHLMEFALDEVNGTLVALGSCGYRGGLSVVDIRSGRASLLGYPAPEVTDARGIRNGLCGERLAVSANTVLIGKFQRPVPGLGRPGALVLVDRRDAAVIADLPTGAEPVDIFTSAK